LVTAAASAAASSGTACTWWKSSIPSALQPRTEKGGGGGGGGGGGIDVREGRNINCEGKIKCQGKLSSAASASECVTHHTKVSRSMAPFSHSACSSLSARGPRCFTGSACSNGWKAGDGEAIVIGFSVERFVVLFFCGSLSLRVLQASRTSSPWSTSMWYHSRILGSMHPRPPPMVLPGSKRRRGAAKSGEGERLEEWQNAKSSNNKKGRLKDGRLVGPQRTSKS
jgi:hypothetical protein